MFILAHHTDWYRFYVFFLGIFCFQSGELFCSIFFVLFSKIQCSTIFNCFPFTSTRISKKSRAIVLTKDFGALLRVCKCYIVELIESYVFLLSNIWNLPFLACNLNATFMQICVLFLFVINPSFSISAARTHCFNTNNHKNKNFLCVKK